MGHVQDKNGLKMSKHKGNVVSPWDILDKQGSDAIRWFFFVNSAPWLPCRFDEEQVNETQRKFLGTLWNTYAFYVLYAEIDQFNPMDYKLEYNKLPAIDKWILSRLNTLVKETRENLDNFRITEPARALNSFVDELSNWYVRRSRERFWAKGMEQDKINAYMTLYTVLTTLSRVAAPFVPYMTEEIYQNLVVNFDKSACESIHLTLFPEYDESMIDTELEKNMETVLEIVVNGRAARNSANIKNRQPIGVMYVKCAEELPKMYVDIIAEELNVKEVKFTTSTDGLTGYNMKPQLRTLGPKYGKLVPKIKEYLADADGSEIVPKLRNGETITFAIDGTEVSLTEADVLVEVTEKSGFVTEADARLAVVLDTNLTPELIEEGFVREIVSKVQTMRKEAGFEVMDRIRLGCKGNSRIADVITRNENEIRKDVLANDFADGALSGYEKEWNINGETVTLSVEKL